MSDILLKLTHYQTLIDRRKIKTISSRVHFDYIWRDETCNRQKNPYMIGGWRESSEGTLPAPSELTANWELGSLISSLSSFPGLK